MAKKSTKATTPKPEDEHDLREDIALDEADDADAMLDQDSVAVDEDDDDEDWEDWQEFDEVEYEEDNDPAKGYYLLKVELQKTTSPVWRRLLLRDIATIDDLNDEILRSFEWEANMGPSIYKDDKFKKMLSIDVGGYMDPNPTLRQVIKPGMTLGYELDDSSYVDQCTRCLIKVEKFVTKSSDLPSDLVTEQGSIDDDIPERFFLLKVQLLGFKPPIWRRILISNKARFSDLHYEIQEKFGWDNDHLAGFFAGKGYTGELCSTEDFPGSFTPDPKLYRYLRVGVSFGYIFDFGDDWRHRITVEKAVADKSELPKKLIWAKGDNVPQYPDSYYDEDED